MICQSPYRYFITIATVGLLLAVMNGGVWAGITIDADDQYRYAQSRLEREAYGEAIAEFHRFIHFFPDDPKVPRARFQIGMAHFGAGRFGAAAAVFNRLSADPIETKLATESHFMLSRSHARQGRHEQAVVDLHNLMTVATDPDVIDRARYELGWRQVDQGRWEAASRVFGQISANNQGSYGVTELRRRLARSDRIPTKNPKTAGLLSIVPGAGQLYCNRYQDALTAFLVNAGLIWAAWEAFDNELYALGSVIGFVEFGFYAGNIYGAVSSAHKYNRDRQAAFRDDLYRSHPISISLGPVPHGVALGLRVAF